MSAQFTPGPWSFDEDQGIIDVKIGSQADRDRFAYARLFLPTWDHGRPDGQDRANARLIAAAPDLLAAAREAYENCGLHQSDCNGVPQYVEGDIFDDTVGCDCYLSRIKSAIDKAEGREP